MITVSLVTAIVIGFALLSAGACFGLLVGALLNAAAEADRQRGLE